MNMKKNDPEASLTPHMDPPMVNTITFFRFAILFFHVENDDTTATKVFVLREDANDCHSSEICLKNTNQENTTCQLKSKNKPIRIPTACQEDTDHFDFNTSETDSHMIIKGSSKTELLKYSEIKQDHNNSIKTGENLLLELNTETKPLEDESKGQRSGLDGIKPGMLN